MSLRVAFDLEETDLEYFRSIIRRAGTSAGKASEEEVVANAEAMINEVKAADLPAFAAQRIDRVGSLIDMLRDDEWKLGEASGAMSSRRSHTSPSRRMSFRTMSRCSATSMTRS